MIYGYELFEHTIMHLIKKQVQQIPVTKPTCQKAIYKGSKAKLIQILRHAIEQSENHFEKISIIVTKHQL